MGSNFSKGQAGNQARESNSRTKKNLKAAEKLELERHSNRSFFHREHIYEDIRSSTLRKAHGTRSSGPMPRNVPDIQPPPATYCHHSASPLPSVLRAPPSPVFSHVSAVPAPLTVRKQPRDVPSTRRPMFTPASVPSSSQPVPFYPPTATSRRPTGSASRRARSRSPPRQRQPTAYSQPMTPGRPMPASRIPTGSAPRRARSRSPLRRPQSTSSRRHGSSTARYPPPSDRAPPPLSSRNILPSTQPSRSEAPQRPSRSGRTRVTRDDVRRR